MPQPKPSRCDFWGDPRADAEPVALWRTRSPLDAVHTKAHTLLSWRFMAVSTRNFVNVSIASRSLGAHMQMTRTYNRMFLVERSTGRRTPLSPTPLLSPRQAARTLEMHSTRATRRVTAAWEAGG